MNKICTSYEQSQSLLALGLDPNTADMKYDPRWDIPVIISEDDYDNHLNYCPESENTDIPAWSLSALLELIPDELQDNHFLTLEKEKDEYCCCFEDINGNTFNHFFGNNAIDATFEMMCWLLDSRKL